MLSGKPALRFCIYFIQNNSQVEKERQNTCLRRKGERKRERNRDVDVTFILSFIFCPTGMKMTLQ